ncbi:MAG: hypothetical protein EP344_11580 [Bacteroidetes bacterium]|nr:MAG: hypothetical protein EP344_11580 [Bacteroidota bacterium]
MKQSFFFTIVLFCTILFSRCDSCGFGVDEEFIKTHGMIDNTKVHVPQTQELVLCIKQEELQECTGDCTGLQETVNQLSDAVGQYHQGMNTARLDYRECPCCTQVKAGLIQPESCVWDTTALYKYLNDNQVFQLKNIQIEETDGTLISGIDDTLHSPSGRYTIYKMQRTGINTDSVIVNMLFENNAEEHLKVYIKRSQ